MSTNEKEMTTNEKGMTIQIVTTKIAEQAQGLKKTDLISLVWCTSIFEELIHPCFSVWTSMF